ncbi:hypothetical protein C8F04DRAFT_1118254 [Mycena alexandri]|uniref:Deoxyribonuclease NucA/NucB domain-containing protein n=1 Tax=Mycena alexandri TaxID=1745969 RepID=A0AAD6RZL9_9AGAR|nr:hypothetical protein C8F04DRAFT_1157068 [Mycena alexandri]KAJ7028852.1 hypothetical protein C8F04DRAFT_1118254 [Mycena alexandri]
MIPSRHPHASLPVTLLFLPFALCHPEWDAPNLAIPGPSSGSGNATGLNLSSKNTTSPLAFALSLSSSLTPLLIPHALTSRQEEEEECVVPGDILCAGEQRCCKPDETCEPTFCCPDIAQTCNNPTEICCEPGGPCCGRSPTGCCAPGATCCENTKYPVVCCSPGTACHVLGCCPNTAQKCNGATCCDTNAVCCPGSETGCCIPGAVCCGGECCAAGSTCDDGICGAADPTLTFRYLKGHNDELIENICRGMGGSNSDTLTYSGPASTKEARAAKDAKRVKQGCTPGLCDWTNTKKSCDEASLLFLYFLACHLSLAFQYPFASTDEGGGNRASGVVLCVPDYQNNWQGQLMAGWINALKNSGFKKGSKFNVKVTGIDCSKFKRDTGTITSTGQGSMLWPPLEYDPTNQSFIMVSLGDLPVGSYSLKVNLTAGAVTSASLVDNEGEGVVNVMTVPTPGRPMQISFDLEYDGIGVGLALFTNDTRTNVSYTAVGTPSVTTGTPSLTTGTTMETAPTAPTASGGLIGIEPSWLSLLFLVLLVAHVA